MAELCPLTEARVPHGATVKGAARLMKPSFLTTPAGGFSPAGRKPARMSDSERAALAYEILRESNPLLPPLSDEARLGVVSGARRQRGGPHRRSEHTARWRPIPKQLWGRLMSLVEEFDRNTKVPRQQGALKQSGVNVYRGLLFGFLHPRSGQCDPSYEALAARTGLSRATVHKALERLELFGLIERTRRGVPRAMMLNGRRIGTTYEQTSNGYRLSPPRRISLFIDIPPKAAELWDGWVKAWQSMLSEVAELLKSSESNFSTESTPSNLYLGAERPSSPLDAALMRLSAAIRRSEESTAYGGAGGASP